MDATLTIGQVASKAGLNASTIRFYEQEALLPEPERAGGKRRYDSSVLDRLAVIDVAKRAGFSLEDARLLLTAADEGSPAHEQLSSLAERKLPEVEALIARAEAMRDWLQIASGCGCQTLDACSLFNGKFDAPEGTAAGLDQLTPVRVPAGG